MFGYLLRISLEENLQKVFPYRVNMLPQYSKHILYLSANVKTRACIWFTAIPIQQLVSKHT